jgi:hypothetical protein
MVVATRRRFNSRHASSAGEDNRHKHMQKEFYDGRSENYARRFV